jgi:hypothetical protein
MLPTPAIHLLGGAPFAGKSTMLAQLAKAFITGESFLDGLKFSRLEPDEIGIILSDRPWSDNDIWIKKLGIESIQRYSIPDDPHMTPFMREVKDDPIYGFRVFEQCFSALEDPDRIRVLMLDVMTNVFLGKSVHDTPGVHRHMVNFQQFAKQNNLAIIGSCYGTKQKKGQADQYARPVDRIMGAPTLRGCASSLLFLTAPGEDKDSTQDGYQPLHWFSRHGESRTFNLKRDAAGLFVQANDVVTAGSPSRRSWDVSSYIDRPMTRAELVEMGKADGHSKTAMYEGINHAVRTGLIMELPDGRFCLNLSGQEN